MAARPSNAPEHRRFGKYLLLEPIGRGGMAEVFRARTYGAAGFVKDCAIKKILSTLLSDRQFVRMFIDEAKLTARLTHSNIVQVLDLGDIDGSLFIAMEYVEGKDLLEALILAVRNGIAFPVDMTLTIITEVLKGLDYAHSARGPGGEPMNIVHRDVSPSNILISYDGQVKIGDFGIAESQIQSSHTEVGTQKGKTGYMSPEQVVGGVIDHRTDLFAVSVILFEMLTMSRLFKAKTDLDVMLKIRDVDISEELKRLDHYPQALKDIVVRGLSRDPNDRFQSAGEYHDALLEFSRNERIALSDRMVATFVGDLFAEVIEQERLRRQEDPQLDTPLAHPEGRYDGWHGDTELSGSIDFEPWGRSSSITTDHPEVESTPVGVEVVAGTGAINILPAGDAGTEPGPAASNGLANPGPLAGETATAYGAEVGSESGADSGAESGFSPPFMMLDSAESSPIVYDEPLAEPVSKRGESVEQAVAPPVPAATEVPQDKPAVAGPQGEPALQGELSETSLARIAFQIADQQLSGFLQVRAGEVERTFSFARGQLVGDTPRENDQALLDKLKNLPLVSSDETAALQESIQAAGGCFDESIAGSGVTPHVFLLAAHHLLGQRLASLLFEEEGHWAWWPEPEFEPERSSLTVPTVPLVRETIAQEGDKRWLRKKYRPLKRNRLELRLAPENLAALKLSPRELRMVTNLDDAPNVGEIIRIYVDRYGWPEDEVYRHLYKLLERNILGFEGQTLPPLPVAPGI